MFCLLARNSTIYMSGAKFMNSSTVSWHEAICPACICNPKISTINWPSSKVSRISCAMAQTKTHDPTTKSDLLRLIDQTEESLSSTGKFGRFGGVFVPETLVTCLSELALEFKLVLHDPHFQVYYIYIIIITSQSN